MKKEKLNPGAVITELGSSVSNKTGGWRNLKPVVNSKKCIKCGTCWMFCPDNAIKMTKTGIVFDYNFCKGCGICAMQCPAKAIIMEKEEK